MNFKKTIIIAVIFAIVILAYQWDQKRIKTNETREAAESRLVAPKREAISEITVTGKDRTLKLQKQGEAWKLIQPIAARTDEMAINMLLDELDHAKKSSPFDPAGKLEEFGLKVPVLKAEIKATSEKYTQTINLGSKTPAGDEVYAQLPEGKKIFTLPAMLLTQLTKPTNDLRDRRLLPANLNEATSVTLSFAGKTIELAKRGDKWKLRQPIRAAADEDKVGELLRSWGDAKAVNFIDSKTIDPAAYGLDKPFLTGTVNVPGKDGPGVMTLLVGKKTEKDPDSFYAMQQGASYAFTINSTSLEKLHPALDTLRAKQLFKLTSNDVGRIIYDVRGTKIDLVQDSGNRWHYADDKAAKVAGYKVTQNVADLTNLKAVRFFDGPTTPALTGLDKPNLRLTIASKDGKTTETILTGKKDPNAPFVYARMGENGQVIGVDWQQPGKFFMTRDELADKSMFDFDKEAVQQIQIQDGVKKITLSRDKSGGWTAKAEGSKADYQVEGTKVTPLILMTSAMKYERRLDPVYPNDLTLIKTQSLESPARQITFLGDGDRELGRLGIGGQADRYVYVRRGAKEYFAVKKDEYFGVKTSLQDVMSAMTPKQQKL